MLKRVQHDRNEVRFRNEFGMTKGDEMLKRVQHDKREMLKRVRNDKREMLKRV